MIDRSKYRASSSEELQAESEKIKAREQASRGSFLKVEPGINVFRILPAPLKAKSSLYCFPLVTAFLPLLVDEYDKEKGEKTGKQVEKRKPVFNAKVHGNLNRDIVEEYITFASEYFKQTLPSKEALEKIKMITNFKTGIKPSSSWIAYAYKEVGGVKTYGRLQITDGVHKQMDTLCLRQNSSGQPIVVDLFSHPDTGKKIQWTSDPNNSDNKSKNKISILFEQDSPLEDEELEMLESLESLESLYKNCFKRSDFEKELLGLQRFDANCGFNIFQSSAFASIIESCSAEVNEKIAPDEDEDGSDSNDTSSYQPQTSTTPSQPTDTPKAQNSGMPEILQEMDKKTLISVIEKLKLEVTYKVTTPPSKLRASILENICEVYEIEPTDEEALVKIIEDAFESEEGESSAETENGESESEVQEVQEEPKRMTRSSLLDKYAKRK